MPENQFSLTRAASSTGRRVKSKSVIATPFGAFTSAEGLSMGKLEEAEEDFTAERLTAEDL